MITKVKTLFHFISIWYAEIKFRRLVIPNVSALIDSENSSVHWKYLDVNNKTVLDLGCGMWGVETINESSPVFFKNSGAAKIIGIDLNENDLKLFREYFSEHFSSDGSEFLVKKIARPTDVIDLIDKYNVESIKCDIEGFEKVLFGLSRDQWKSVSNISIEYHNKSLFLNLIDSLNRWGFKTINHSIFTYGSPNMGVITAYKN